MTQKYKVTDAVAEGGFHILECTEGEFEGVQWTYGGIKIDDKEDEDGNVKLAFDYDIVSPHQLSEEENLKFGQYTGAILMSLLEDQIAKGEVQYAGGTDEVKTKP